MAIYEGSVVLRIPTPRNEEGLVYGEAKLISGSDERGVAWWRGTLRCSRDSPVKGYVGPASLTIVSDSAPIDERDRALYIFYAVRIVDMPVVDSEGITVKVYGDGVAPFDDGHVNAQIRGDGGPAT